MSPSVSLLIGLRYWRARKDTQFVSFITFFSVAGIALGVAALIVVSSVMNGLEGRLKTRLLGAVPQVLVSESRYLESPDELQFGFVTDRFSSFRAPAAGTIVQPIDVTMLLNIHFLQQSSSSS